MTSNSECRYSREKQYPRVNKYKTGLVTYQGYPNYKVGVTIWNFGLGVWYRLLQ